MTAPGRNIDRSKEAQMAFEAAMPRLHNISILNFYLRKKAREKKKKKSLKGPVKKSSLSPNVKKEKKRKECSWCEHPDEKTRSDPAIDERDAHWQE